MKRSRIPSTGFLFERRPQWAAFGVPDMLGYLHLHEVNIVKGLKVVALTITVLTLFACRGTKDAFIYEVLGSSAKQGVEVTVTWVVSHPGGEFRLRQGASGFSGQRLNAVTTIYGRISNATDSSIRVFRSARVGESGHESGVELVTARESRRRGSLLIDVGESPNLKLEGEGYFDIPSGQIMPFSIRFDGTVSETESPVSVEINNIRLGDADEAIAIVVRDITLRKTAPVRIDPYGNLPPVDFRDPAMLRNTP